MAQVYRSRFLKSINGEHNYKITRYDRTDLRAGPSVGALDANETEGDAPLEVAFEVQGVIPASKWAGPTVTRIDTADGVIIEDDEGSHEYEDPGVYDARALVSDGVGRTVTTTTTIAVTDPE